MFTLLRTATAWPQGTSVSRGLKSEQRSHEPAVGVFVDAGGIGGQAVVHVGQVGVGGEVRESAGAVVRLESPTGGE